MPHRGLGVRGLQHLAEAIRYGMLLMYIGRETPQFPLTDHTPTQHDRNHQIRALYAQGKTEMELAQLFGISHQRVSQILHGRRK